MPRAASGPTGWRWPQAGFVPTAAPSGRRERAKLARQRGELQQQMRALENQMRALEKPMKELETRMDPLNREMEVLGKKMEVAAPKAEGELRALLRRAIANGIATQVR